MMCEVNVLFCLQSDFLDHDFITNELQLKPTNIKKKGTKGKYGSKYKYDAWIFETGYIKTSFADDEISKIYNLFKNKVEKIKKLNKKFGLHVKLEIAIRMGDDSAPSLYFDSEVMKFLYEIGAEIDIDILV